MPTKGRGGDMHELQLVPIDGAHEEELGWQERSL